MCGRGLDHRLRLGSRCEPGVGWRRGYNRSDRSDDQAAPRRTHRAVGMKSIVIGFRGDGLHYWSGNFRMAMLRRSLQPPMLDVHQAVDQRDILGRQRPKNPQDCEQSPQHPLHPGQRSSGSAQTPPSGWHGDANSESRFDQVTTVDTRVLRLPPPAQARLGDLMTTSPRRAGGNRPAQKIRASARW